VVEWSADQSGLPRTRKGMKRSREYTRRVSSLSTAVGNGCIVAVSSSVEGQSRGLATCLMRTLVPFGINGAASFFLFSYT